MPFLKDVVTYKKWGETSVRHMLANQTYVGDTINNKSTQKFFAGQDKRDLSKEQWYVAKNTHPAIIARDDFEKVQDILAKNQKVFKTVRAETEQIRTEYQNDLAGMVFCADCGRPMDFDRLPHGAEESKKVCYYQFDPNKKGSYIIDPPAAKIVRRIFDLAILGLRTREIAMTLNDENAPVPSVYNREHKAYGKETTYTIAPVILWDSTRVWKILTAYVYTGAMVLGKSQRLISGKPISRTVPKGQQYITEGTHEAIVSREEFEKAQLVINNRNKVVMGSVDFPLKGKVRCGNCRRAMGYDYKQASPIFWCREGQELIGQTKCSSEIFQANDIENAVFQALKKELSLLGSLYGDIKKEEQSLKEASRKAIRRKTSMEQELKNLKGEKMRMYEEYAAGTLSLDNYKNKKQEYDRKIAEVQDKIEQSKAEEAAQSVVPGTVRAAAEQAENFLHGTRLTASMVSAFIENVYVHEGG